MTNWTDGYQTGVNYTYGYYRDLSPHYQKFCLLLNGIDSPTLDENSTHCELGFGQGVSINIHAASQAGSYVGNDFNPAHAAHANALAKKSQVNSHFYDDSFEELLNRTDLPMFDSISLHGIWSWISFHNQSIIMQFIRRHLKAGGIVYISYNCLTGWSANMPVRELFYSHFNYSNKNTDTLQQVKESLAFSEQLLALNPNYAQRNPNALKKVQELSKQNPNYLVHEYLNQDWQCFSFRQISQIFEENKLSFAGTSDLNNHLDQINFSQEHQQFIQSIQHPILKEQVREIFANTQFRKDLFIRGKNQLSIQQTQQRLKETSFIIFVSPENAPKKIQGFLGEFNLLPEIYEPLVQYFKEKNYTPQSIGALEKALPQLNYSQILNALTILCHLNIAQPCLDHAPSQQTITHSQNLNRHFLEETQFHQNYTVFASPHTGIGFQSEYFETLFLKAHFLEDLKTTKQYADYAQKALDHLGWQIVEKGNSITDRKESLQHLQNKADDFIKSDKIKIVKQLQLFA